jgi:hypothetical protein
MKRINIVYGGTMYSVPDRELADLHAEIAAGMKSDEPSWLTVNEGEGTPRVALLLITPGMNLALIPISEPHQNLEDSTSELVMPPAR